jgi:hypothetical protein
MISKYLRVIIPACLLLVNTAGAGDSTVISSMKITGYGSFQGGQVVKGFSYSAGLPDQGDRLAPPSSPAPEVLPPTASMR